LKKNKRNFRFPKVKLFVFHILCYVGILIFTVPDFASAGSDVRDSMVKIYSVRNQPDYDNPWNMKGPQALSGSGCVIENNRILTNAHVVSDHTFIQVRLHGQSKKFTAKVLAISHDADLVLLTVEDPSFFKEIKPLKFGELPAIEQEVVVYGFPEGGDTLSTSKGVVSRIEHQQYVHSGLRLLAGQLDAAINYGNSGGPVIVNESIVGVVMQILKESENIGYMVPVTVIKHFLIDLADGHYDGFPEDGVTIQPLENTSLKKMYGLKADQTGSLVISVTPGSAAESKLFPGDVLLSIDGHQVADDCTVEFRPKERTSYDFYVKQHQVGEDLVCKVFRNGKEHTVKFALNKSWGNTRLVPMMRYDVRPTYFLYGGLVICPLTFDYIKAWGDDWSENAPYNLVNFFTHSRPTQEGEEVVIIIKVLPSGINNGYDDFTNERIVEVNGQKIRHLRHLVSIVESSFKNPFIVFKTEKGHTIALDRKKADEKQAEILGTYRISADRSTDLQVASSNNILESEKTVKIATSNAKKLR